MKKKSVSILIIIIILIFAYEILTNASAIIKSVTFSFTIWKNNIFPSLFPFFILSELLINYGFVELLAELLKPIMVKLFKVNPNCAFIFVMSIISGCPSNAKYTLELLKNNMISEHDANKILMFSHFSNPLFILGTVGILFLNNKEVGLFILLCHYSVNILIGLIFRNRYQTKNTDFNISIKKEMNNMNNKRINNNKSFGGILTNSIINTINTLLLILGTITVFLVITTVIDKNINFNTFHQALLNGFIEMTQGLKYVSLLPIPLKLKCSIATIILSFGGLSIHMQVISILSEYNIKYTQFLIARIIHATISGILAYFLFDPWLSLISI